MAKKNAAAVELGRRGGLVKVPKGFAVLTEEQRTANASAAAKVRWAKPKKAVGKAVKKATPKPAML